MVRLVSSRRFAVAFVAVVFSFACSGGDDEKDPPIDEEPGPSTGSTCPENQTLTHENFGIDFFATYCTRCHGSELSGAERHGAPAGYDWDELETVREYAALIDKMAAAGPDAMNMIMPPSEPRPTLDERERLGEWLECGAP